MSTIPAHNAEARRAVIEEALRRRLEADAATAPAALTSFVSSDVALECTACRVASGIDARFCTGCGAAFNVRVVSANASDATRGPRS